MSNIKITDDGFVWLVVTEKAKEIFISGLFSLYELHDDSSESLIVGFEQLNDALANGLSIGIEVGFTNDDIDLFQHIERLPKNIQYTIERYTDSDSFSYDDCRAMLVDMESQGYTFEYGLDAEPYNLKRMQE
jgi:hypothetical protein